MVYCVGLTGNIGSGKSTAAALFAELGIAVFNADVVAKQLTAVNSFCYEQIYARYGDEVLLANRELNRRYLREIIFNSPVERQWLEALLHPRIREELQSAINHCQTPYCVVEIPLLNNRQDYPYLQRVILIIADLPVQIARIRQRDHCSEEQAKAIINSQLPPEQRRHLADDILINNGNREQLKQSIQTLHQNYLSQK